jgi:flavin-binding protein dodecin
MSVVRVTKVIASSPKGIQEAIEEGLKRANKSLRGLTQLEITNIKVQVKDGKIADYRVHMNISFVLED